MALRERLAGGDCSASNCAGGNGEATIAPPDFFQTTPSVDGSSLGLYITGAPGSDGLWWYKVGPNDAVSNFESDFWVYFNSATSSADALEFDTFQFNNGVEYMFGTQCNYLSGYWDVWNAGTTQWVQTSAQCREFQPNTWYHLRWKFHRTSPNNYEHYDSLTLEQTGYRGRQNTSTYNFNLAFPSRTMPSGWTDNMGVQFQMDIGGDGASMEEWVDEVTLVTH